MYGVTRFSDKGTRALQIENTIFWRRDLHAPAKLSQLPGSSMPTWLHRFILFVAALACVGVIGLLGTVLVQTRAEYVQVQQAELAARERLAEVEARLAEQEVVLDRLRNDPAYLERVIRSRLGYAKPEEFVFRFSD